MTFKIEIDFQDTFVDVTDTYDSCTLLEGNIRFDPDRPIFKSAQGTLTLRYKPDNPNNQYPARITVNNEKYWEGFVLHVSQSHDKPDRSTWKLQGKYSTLVEEQIGLSEPSSTIAEVLASLNSVVTKVEQVEIANRATGVINFTGSAGEAISRLANIASAIPTEQSLTDALKFTSIIASEPETISVIDSTKAKVFARVTSSAQKDSIRNKATIQQPDTVGETHEQTADATISILSPNIPSGSVFNGTNAYKDGTFTGQIAFGGDGTISNIRITPIGDFELGQIGEVVKVSTGGQTRYALRGPMTWVPWAYRRGGTERSTAQAEVSINDTGLVTVTVPQRVTQDGSVFIVPKGWGIYQLLRGISNVSFEDTIALRFRPSLGTPYPISQCYGYRQRVRVRYSFTESNVPVPPRIIVNTQSIQKYGIRELEIDDWLSSNADLTKVIEQLGELRTIYTVDIPTTEPLATSLKVGDYVLAHLKTDDSINKFTLILGKHLHASQIASDFVRFSLLELDESSAPPIYGDASNITTSIKLISPQGNIAHHARASTPFTLSVKLLSPTGTTHHIDGKATPITGSLTLVSPTGEAGEGYDYALTFNGRILTYNQNILTYPPHPPPPVLH